MQITSTAFQHNESIPTKYTCDGENVNPPLTFSEIPATAASLMLIVDDPDAPSKTWTHWVVYNIPASTMQILEDSVPEASSEGLTDFRSTGYGGPCPPSGVHRYFFKLYALDTELNLPPGLPREEVEEAMRNHILASAELIGLYKRG